jgi:hypothetical protein
MKRVFAVSLILALLVSAFFGVCPLYLVKAQSSPVAKPPVITILSPEDTTYATGSILLSFNVTVGEALQFIYYAHLTSVYFKGDWQENVTSVSIPVTEDHTLADSLQFTVQLVEVPEGSRSIMVYAEEIVAGPYSWLFAGYNSSRSIAFTVDATPPSVSVLSPQDGGFEGLDASLNFTVNEATSQLAYCLDGVVNVAVAGNTTLRYGLSAGEHSVVVYAWDEAGNVGVSAPVTFTVTEFPATLVIAAVVVAVVVVCAGLLLHFLRRKR